MSKNYIIAGATGLVGGEILSLLANDEDAAKVITLGRRAPDQSAKNFEFIKYDFSKKITWPKKPAKAAIAICALGTTIKVAGSQEVFRKVDYDYVIRFAEAVKACAVQSLHVVTAHGASATSSIFYNRVKGEVENTLKSMDFTNLHIYHPSLLLGERKEHRPGEGAATFAVKLLSPLFKLPGLNAVQPTPAKQLAAYILRVAATEKSGRTHSNLEILKEKPVP